MSDTDRTFAGSIPAIYDHYLGPLIFEPYATDLADRLAQISMGRVLETAAGTGIVTRALARTLSGGVDITATDLNQPMLDFAAAQTADQRVTWRQADALHLPFDDGSFDVVLCQFGAMFFPDRVAAYAEARRVLKPTGKFIFSVWDRIEENDFAAIVTQTMATLFPQTLRSSLHAPRMAITISARFAMTRLPRALSTSRWRRFSGGARPLLPVNRRSDFAKELRYATRSKRAALIGWARPPTPPQAESLKGSEQV
jgi:SAM-dependent methyltransferase